MFVDEREIQITAGKGGDGVALFRREIYVPHGGPDGGDGGKGGDVLIIGRGNTHALSHLSHIDRIKAEDGAKGGHQRSTGKSGENTIVFVPLGTLIYRQNPENHQWVLFGDVTEEGQSLVVAKGGNGGWGNWHFKSSIQQAPERFNPGQAGESFLVKLELKLIADIGLVGLPNAGKSTLLAAVSHATPKIADYPFTTLEPQLGVAELRDHKEVRSWVIADLPGLIEGASQGKGLGHTFLRHLERTKSIIHCIDSTQPIEEILTNYKIIRKELVSWSKTLAGKPELIALTKIDALDPTDLTAKITVLKSALKLPIYPISAIAHKGLTELLTDC